MTKHKQNKQHRAPAAPKAADSAPAASAAPAPAPKVEVITVLKTDGKFRGARDKWYARLVEHDGKPVADFVASCTADPPSVPKSGVVEKPTGWISYFKRQGIVALKAVEAN